MAETNRMKKRGRKQKAVLEVARALLRVELAMEHVESTRKLTVVEIKNALEAAYDAGARASLS